MTSQELDLQVALAMEWKSADVAGFVLLDPKTSTLYRACPLFTEGEDANTVRAWLESEGLTIEERSYLHHFEHTEKTERRYGCRLRDREGGAWSVWMQEGRGLALCEAMLAYCASKKELKKESE